jgi:hypothetical protein
MAQLPTGTKTTKPLSALARADAVLRARSEEREMRLPARIGFVIDATGSRAHNWQEAQMIQAQMFESLAGSNPMKLRIVYFGGSNETDLGWEDRADVVGGKMADVRCEGGYTRILPSLARFLDDDPEPASAIILIGDSIEEYEADVAPLAHKLKAVGIKVFAFLEGPTHYTEKIFSEIAHLTGGRYAEFGSDLPLSDLCEGVALLTSDGAKGVKRIENKKVRLLLSGPPNNPRN